MRGWPSPRTSPSTTRAIGPAGCERRCSARTTASCRSRASSSASRPPTRPASALVTAGLAGLVAGAMSMAVGEYISVSSQRDAEQADLRVEAEAIAENRRAELHELAKIYEDRGVEPGLARLVADQLMAHDAVGAHARDELGISEIMTARPLQAALDLGGRVHARRARPGARGHALGQEPSASGCTAVLTIVALIGLGALGAQLGGAPRGPGRAPRRHAVGAVDDRSPTASAALVGANV